MQLLVTIVVSLTLLTSFTSGSSAAVDPKDKGAPLFPDGHANITYLTDKNWDYYMNKTDKPWIVDFYHPFCPHCKYFAPLFVELAAYYVGKGNIYVGALSCMDHVKCRRIEITGFPTLMALNFDRTKPKMENKRIVGTFTVQEVKDYVTDVFAEVTFNTTGAWPPGYVPPNKNATEKTLVTEEDTQETSRPEVWEESTLPMNQTTRIQDAASAFVFGLKQGVFMASDVMDDETFDALKSWLKVVSKTFPGAINRKLITSLYEKIMDKELLDFDTWDAIVKQWQEGSIAAFKAEEARFNFTRVSVPEWQRLNDLFLGQGATYRACALYTCGQWNMFHMLTLNPPETGARTGELMVSVAASIRRFVMYFFGCVDCRDHFLKDNTVEVVKKIQNIEDKPLALRRWLWEQHNAVNKRLNHPLWPKPEVCPTCGGEGAWELVEVDKWLSRTFGYRDVVAPLLKTAETAPTNSATAVLRGVEHEAKAPLVIQREEAEAPSFTHKEEAETPSFTQREEAKAPLFTQKEKAEALSSVQKEETKVNDNAAADESKTERNGPIVVEPQGGYAYRPKDAELGIKNAANTKELVVDMKNKPQDGLQGVAAPPITLFAWYIVPVAAVGSYLLFVRYRAPRQKAYRQIPRK